MFDNRAKAVISGFINNKEIKTFKNSNNTVTTLYIGYKNPDDTFHMFIVNVLSKRWQSHLETAHKNSFIYVFGDLFSSQDIPFGISVTDFNGGIAVVRNECEKKFSNFFLSGTLILKNLTDTYLQCIIQVEKGYYGSKGEYINSSISYPVDITNEKSIKLINSVPLNTRVNLEGSCYQDAGLNTRILINDTFGYIHPIRHEFPMVSLVDVTDGSLQFNNSGGVKSSLAQKHLDKMQPPSAPSAPPPQTATVVQQTTTPVSNHDETNHDDLEDDIPF